MFAVKSYFFQSAVKWVSTELVTNIGLTSVYYLNVSNGLTLA